MRTLLVLLLSALLHLAVLSLDDRIWLAQGEPEVAQKVGYTVRSVESFLPNPVVEEIVEPKHNPPERRPKKTVKPPPKAVKPKPPEKIVKPVQSKPVETVIESTLEKDPLPLESEILDVEVEPVDDELPLEDAADVEVDESEPLQEDDSPEDITVEVAAPPAVADETPKRPAAEGESHAAATVVAEQGILKKAQPRYDINPRPKYPKVARVREWEGVVVLKVQVLKNGRVGELKVDTSSGYRSLDNAAKKTVRRWRFFPAVELGLPVESYLLVPIEFSLTNAGQR